MCTAVVVSTSRRLAGDRDRFFELADLELDVDRGRELGGQLDALAANGLEARQDERNDVHARSQIDDAVHALPVGDDGLDLFDQRVAGGFDVDAREDGPG